MKLIIIGSEGFIGAHLCDHFLSRGYEVFGADIIEAPANSKYQYSKVSRLSNEWEELLTANTFDFCINAAGSSNVSYSVSHPLIDFEANSFDVIKILDAIRKSNPHCKYLHISSAAVYGNPIQLPIRESDPLNPVSPYGYHKMMSELICKEYFALFGIRVAIIRPFSIFGNRLRKQLLWDICSKCKKDDPIILFGTGEETRDFIHISDFVLLIGQVMHNSNFHAEIINAATGYETSIRSVADIFERYYADSRKITFNGNAKPGDPTNWKADITALQNLGFIAKADFEKEIIEYINWFNKVYEN